MASGSFVRLVARGALHITFHRPRFVTMMTPKRKNRYAKRVTSTPRSRQIARHTPDAPSLLAPAARNPYHWPVRTPSMIAYSLALPAGSDPLALLALPEADAGPRAFWSAYDDHVTIAAIGAEHVATADGPDRLATIACATAAARAEIAVGGDGPADVIWLGGFAFDDGPTTGPWAAFGSARFTLPTALVVRRGAAVRLTAIGNGADADAVAARARALAARLAAQPALVISAPGDAAHPIGALRDDAPAVDAAMRSTGPNAARDLPAPTRSHDPAPSDDLEAAHDLAARLGAAVGALRRGDADKVVIGTTRTVPLAAAPDAAGLLARMATGAPGCTRVLIAPAAGGSLIAATPERLVAVAGRRLRTMALAGTAPRGRDVAADDALGRALLASAKDRAEHAHVVDAIRAALAGAALSEPGAPRLRRLATLQHLETMIDGRLPTRGDVLAEAARLHPTPALGGWPRDAALALVARLEPEPRGWFGGAVGWLDGRGDGDLAVVIRALLLRPGTATAFAGAGLVAASDPAAEAREIALKLRTAFAPIEAFQEPVEAMLSGATA